MHAEGDAKRAIRLEDEEFQFRAIQACHPVVGPGVLVYREDGAVGKHIDAYVVGLTGRIVSASQIDGAAMFSLGIEYGKQLASQGERTVANGNGVALPGFGPEELPTQVVSTVLTPEVAWAVALLSPRRQVVSRFIKDQQLVRPAIGDDDSPVSQLERVIDPVKLKSVVGLDGTYGEDGLGGDLPTQA